MLSADLLYTCPSDVDQLVATITAYEHNCWKRREGEGREEGEWREEGEGREEEEEEEGDITKRFKRQYIL